MTQTKTLRKVNGFTYTTAIRKLRKLKKRIREVPGGTSAGKTYGILPILIDQATKTEGLEISVVSESIPHLRKGALKDFLKIMKATGRYIDAHYNRTLLTYTFANGSYIEFFSADQEDKVRGPRRNILYVNECNNITFETYHQLAIRTSETIWLDYNPACEFWVHTELRGDPDLETLILTYQDNEALSESIIKEIEKAKYKAFHNPNLGPPELFNPSNVKSSYWCNWWKVYGLGMVGNIEGLVFTNWSTIDEVPKGAKLLGYGMDFGYTNDPTTLIALYRHQGRLIYDEIVYETGLKTRNIANKLKEQGIRKTSKVSADHDPRLIDEINEYGLGVREAGNKNIEFGIQVMQEEDFYVTKRSVNLIRELRRYMWATDKTGKSINKPEQNGEDHAIDAARYITVDTTSQRNQNRRGVRRRN